MAIKEKPFAGDRFVFADSQPLGPAPWDSRLQTLARSNPKSQPSSKMSGRRLNCCTSLNVSNVVLVFDLLALFTSPTGEAHEVRASTHTLITNVCLARLEGFVALLRRHRCLLRVAGCLRSRSNHFFFFDEPFL